MSVDEFPDAIFAPNAWAGLDSEVSRRVVSKSEEAVASYRADPYLIDEHANKELATAQGGYGRRQVYELVQNAADELLDHAGGAIKLLLTEDALYCANQGSAISTVGVTAILMSDLSVKRAGEIGRFGLGFKSLLGISSRPAVISRSGSFAFDPDDAERRILGTGAHPRLIPKMRTALPIDAKAVAGLDPDLKDLMRWATTVVKVPRDNAKDWLSDDFARFPAEFLLFSPHVGTVYIEDRTVGKKRVIQMAQDGRHLVLREDGIASRWLVFSQEHHPSQAAKDDAGAIAARDIVPVIWAVQTEGSRTRGRFWSFFPTEVATTLSGIVNAPWKTNSDRQNLLAGPFNRELLKVASDLVLSHLTDLAPPDDPGRVLDLIPARGREAPSWADEELTELVYEGAKIRASVPDQSGSLTAPARVLVAPPSTPEAALAMWEKYPGRPMEWMHASAYRRDRRPRAERLIPPGRQRSYSQWLESLASDGSAAASIAALQVMDACLDADMRTSERDDLLKARIVLAADGLMAAPTPHALVLGRPIALPGQTRFVHPDVQSSDVARRILDKLGIKELDPGSLYEVYLKSIHQYFSDWESFWRETAKQAAPQALAALRENPQVEARLRFRTTAGTFEDRNSVLLPGPIVSESGSADRECTVDLRFHASTRDVIDGLRLNQGPSSLGGLTLEPWFAEYREQQIQASGALAASRTRLPPDGFAFSERYFNGPIQPLFRLSDAGRARFTSALLALEPDSRTWKMRHTTRAIDEVRVEDPVTWAIRRRGLLTTSLGPRAVADSVGPSLSSHADYLPVASCTAAWAARLGLPDSPATVPARLWDEALRLVEAQGSTVAGRLYGIASAYIIPPERIVARRDGVDVTCPPSEAFVTHDPKLADGVSDTGSCVVLVADAKQADGLISRWKLQVLEGLSEPTIQAVPIADPEPITDIYPGLRPYLTRAQAKIEITRSSEIVREITGPSGARRDVVETARDGDTLYCVDPGDDRALLDVINEALELRLSPDERNAVVESRAGIKRGKLLDRIQAADTPASKLLAAVGRDAITRHIDKRVLVALEEERGPLSDEDVASLAWSIHGVDLFRTYRHELRDAGLATPDQWTGKTTARAFVQALGLPRAYAGFEMPRRDPLLEVEGPSPLPALHPFQAEITHRIRSLLRDETKRRALLSLPTGAGKTRVTVEALVDAIKNDGLRGPILWLAPTGELCEQAVQTWAYVWRSKGSSERLSIGRLWEGNQVEESDDSGVQVIVATDAKLHYIIPNPGYTWLANASVVIVDEAHGSTETGYTSILTWLGLGRSQARDRCPLIGLTATPFKGISEEATKRLANRYGARRLDDGVLGDDPYRQLQEMGVLARANQRVLEGANVALSQEQAEEARRLNTLPRHVEEAIASDTNRNRQILSAVRDLDSDWTAILFAASVSHAEQMAALLNFEGIPSAVISAQTDQPARRHYIREFNRGAIRVLCNYGVLTEGFDAPSVRAVIVGRPTFSPNAYQQMVGRGLRGPLNGGKAECLVINVADNILQFGGQLAFHHFDYLFDGQ